jgi:hypothetical protein
MSLELRAFDSLKWKLQWLRPMNLALFSFFCSCGRGSYGCLEGFRVLELHRRCGTIVVRRVFVSWGYTYTGLRDLEGASSYEEIQGDTVLQRSRGSSSLEQS